MSIADLPLQASAGPFQIHPDPLEKHAEFVAARECSRTYRAYVQSVLPYIATYLQRQLAADGWRAGALDTTTAFSLILDHLGIWNYICQGSLTVTFAAATTPPLRWEYAVIGLSENSGHAWLVVPPYRVVDIDLRLPQGSQTVVADPPQGLLEGRAEVGAVEMDDVVPGASAALSRRCRETDRIEEVVESLNPALAKTMRRFPPVLVHASEAEFKYIPCRICAPMSKFAEHVCPGFSGRSTAQVYSDLLTQADLDDVRLS